MMAWEMIQTLKDNSAYLKNKLQQTYQQTTSAAKTTYDLIRTAVNVDIDQFWLAYSRVVDPATLTKLYNSPKTTHILKQSAYTNLVLYLGSALMYEGTKKAIHQAFLESEDSVADTALDTAAFLYFLRLSFQFYTDNAAYYFSLPKATAEENPNYDAFKHCSCKVMPLIPARIVPPPSVIRANLEAPIYYYGNAFFIHTMKMYLEGYLGEFGKLFIAPLEAYFHGYNFMEYNLGQWCTKHRAALLSKNHSYVLGLGASFLSIYELERYLLKSQFNIQNPYVDTALFNFLYQYFIMISLMTDKPLAGKTASFDVFSHSRLLTKSIVKNLTETISKALQTPGEPLISLDTIKNSAIVNYAHDYLVPKDYQTIKNIAFTPAVQSLLQLHKDNIETMMSVLDKMQNSLLLKKTNDLLAYVPNFIVPESIHKGLSVYLQENMRDLLKNLRQFFNTVLYDKPGEDCTTLIMYDETAIPLILNEQKQEENKQPMVTIHDAEALKQLTQSIPTPAAPSNVVSPLHEGWEIIEDYNPNATIKEQPMKYETLEIIEDYSPATNKKEQRAKSPLRANAIFQAPAEGSSYSATPQRRLGFK